MTSGGYGSQRQEENLGSETVTAPTKSLIDAAQALAAMNAPQLVKQTSAGPNSALPQRLGVAGALQDDARYATSNLMTGVAKQGGIPAPGQRQTSAQRQFSHRQQAVINMVMQVKQKAEDSDRILYSNQILLNKRRRDEGLQVMLNEMLSNGVETEGLLHQQAEALTQKHKKVVTEMQVVAMEGETRHNKIITEMQVAAKEAERLLAEEHDRMVAALQDAAKETEALVEKHKTAVTQMQDAAKVRETLHNKIITEMQVSAEEAEAMHNKTVTKMQADARKEAEKHKKLVTRMEEDQKTAHIKLVESKKRFLSAEIDAHMKAEMIRYDIVMNGMNVIRKENAEYNREINARKEREQELLQKQSNLKAEVEKQYNKYFSAQISYEVAKEEQTTAEKEHEKYKRAMNVQIESLTSQLEALKEEKTTSENEHGEAKQAMNAQLESLMSQLAKSKQEKATSEKEFEEYKRAMNAQVESLTSQFVALKEEKITAAQEHEECKRILAEMNTKLKSVESQLPGRKQGRTTVGKDDSELQLQLAKLQKDKVKLQKALDTLKSQINSKVHRGSMKLLWEVAEKVLTLPEDVRVCQSVHYASAYDTLLPIWEENNIDKMMSCVHAALNEAAKNWKIAQADVQKIKWSYHKNLVDAVLGRTEPASETTPPLKDFPNSETTGPPRDIPNPNLEYISFDSKDESMEELPQKKRKRLTTLTELKKRQSSCSSSSSQQTKLSLQ